MRSATLRVLPAVLLVPAGAWMVGSDGVALAPWAATATVAAGLVLLLQRGWLGTLQWRTPHTWLAGLTAWIALGALLRPVAPARALYFAAVAATALLLAVVAWTPSTRPWARAATVVVGSGTAVWLLAQRVAVGARPDGPFGSSNLSATVALLGLCLAPFLRARAPARLGLAMLCASGVVASGSRGALLGAAVATAVWIFGGSRTLRRIAAVVLVLAGLGLAWRLAGDRDPLRYGRFSLWAVAVKTAHAEAPWGAGGGGFEDAAMAWNFPREGELARLGRIPSLAESDFLQTAASLGLPGVLLAAGLAFSVLRLLAGAGPAPRGLVAALLTTSAVNTQLIVPVVAWSATLGLAAVLPRGTGRRLRLPWATSLAIVVAGGTLLCVELSGPSWFLDGRFGAARAVADAVLRDPASSDAALADAQARLDLAAATHPREGASWRLLGEVRLRRAFGRHEAGLVVASLDAFRRAGLACPVDVWAKLGEARCLRLLGDRPAARRSATEAVNLEPNMLPGWLELGVLALEEGDLAAARDAVRRIASIQKKWKGHRALSGYEGALLSMDQVAVERLRAVAPLAP